MDGKLAPNDDAWIIARVYRLYLEGWGYRRIVKELKRLGAKGLRGKTISEGEVRYILKNELYVGDKEFGKRKCRNFITGELEDRVKNYIADDHEGIIERSDWDKVQAIRKAGKRNSIHPLYGHVICGCCGGNYRRATQNKKKVWICGQNKNRKVCPGVNVMEDVILDATDGCDFDKITVYLDHVEMGG